MKVNNTSSIINDILSNKYNIKEVKSNSFVYKRIICRYELSVYNDKFDKMEALFTNQETGKSCPFLLFVEKTNHILLIEDKIEKLIDAVLSFKEVSSKKER